MNGSHTYVLNLMKFFLDIFSYLLYFYYMITVMMMMMMMLNAQICYMNRKKRFPFVSVLRCVQSEL